MRKLTLLAVCVGAFLVAPSIAAADTAQGKLTGAAETATVDIEVGATVIDGGTNALYIGKENDKSHNCTGDSGIWAEDGVPFTVLCAHFVASSHGFNAGSPKMRFAIQRAPGEYVVYRITDNGQLLDTFAFGTTTTLAGAQEWVNTGAVGSGLPGVWSFDPLVIGDFTVTA